MLFFIFKNFSKNQKKLKLSPTADLSTFLTQSHVCTFFIQMSDFLYFTCPEVKIWFFSSFSKTFKKLTKIDVCTHRGPVDNFG